MQPQRDSRVIPDTVLVRIGRGFLHLSAPLLIYKAVKFLLGRPINYTAPTVLLMGGAALVGIIVGCSLLGIALIKSAFRN